jgi:hypothetical protein
MRPETQLQRNIRKRLAVRGFDSVHVPNGATLRGTPDDRARQMRNLKLDGFRVGFPDLIVYGKGGRIGHIEVKCEGSYQKPDQRDCQKWLESIDHNYAVCRSQEDVDETLGRWGWL